MHSQHACVESCRYFYLKKGAQKSKDKMIASLNEKIENERREIRSANSAIEWALKDIEKIKNGQLDNIYI
jgi:vacuolar-type H+-ATPase subunit H